jgi:hypothetical protein
MINIPAQVAVSTSTATHLVFVPPGPCQVVLQNNDSTNYVTIGVSSSVAAGNGYELDAGKSLTFSGHTGSTGTDLYALAHTAAVNVSILVSTAQ